MTRDQLVLLGRAALVAKATAMLRSHFPQTNFDPTRFDTVRVLANRKTVVVSFNQSVEYLPLEASPDVRSVTVDLLEDLVVTDAHDGRLTVFVHTPSTRRAVDFVLAALRNDRDFAGALTGLGHEVGLRITERKTDYRAELGGRSFGLAATVSKETGALSERVEERLDEPPVTVEDPLVELKL